MIFHEKHSNVAKKNRWPGCYSITFHEASLSKLKDLSRKIHFPNLTIELSRSQWLRSFPISEQPVLVCFRKLSSLVDGTKASECQNAKRSLHRKLETPLTPQNSLQPFRNSWPEITTLNVKLIRKPETLDYVLIRIGSR